MHETDRLLDAAGIVHAGTGNDLAQARAPGYLETAKGRVAIVSIATSFTPMSRAGLPLGNAPARPGVNALRTRRYVLVSPQQLDTLRAIRDSLPREGPHPPEKTDEVELLNVRYRLGSAPGYAYELEAADRDEILRNIRQAKQNSEFTVATIHAHEPGNWSELPPDFMPALAHAAVDAGADAFIVHGPHRLRGIEIYKGKPIFYSLGNFFFQLNLGEPVPADMYEQMKMDPSRTTDAELNEARRKRNYSDSAYYQSVIAMSRFERGTLAELSLYPVDLTSQGKDFQWGTPRLASPDVARTILERLQRLSMPFGTRLEIQQNTGLIRPSDGMR